MTNGKEDIWPREVIPDEDMVYRQVHVMKAPKIEGKRIPNEANFIPDDDGLSVHWNKYISIEDVYKIISISHNKAGRYIDHTSFKVYQFSVSFLRSVDDIDDVIHDPVVNGNPAPVGSPNNRAHALVLYKNDEEIRLKLTDYVLNNYDQTYCNFNVGSLNQEIEELRARLNDTAYHQLWS